MKFVIVCCFAPSLINFRGRLLEQIVQRGHSVLALAPDFDQFTTEWCNNRNIQTAHIDIDNQSTDMIGDIRTFTQIYHAIRSYNADVVLGYTHKPAIYTAVAGGILRTQHTAMMVTGLGSGFEVGTFKKRIVNTIVKLLFRLACRMSDRIIFHNSDDLAHFIGEGILPSKDKTVVVNGSGVDLSIFARHSFPDVPSSEITFLLVARVVRYKGILEYARAAAELKKAYPNAKFLLAGYQDNTPSAYSAEEWQFIQASVDYLGKSNDVSTLMQRCHVYVLPSYAEGLPRTVLEAMASGRPIITTDANGCRQTVIEGRTGFLVQPRDWQELKDAMEKFLDGRADWNKMGAEAHSFAISAFDVEQVNKHMLEALKL
jgi:glycosyltransferase involved in cell wall biosynthesis